MTEKPITIQRYDVSETDDQAIFPIITRGKTRVILIPKDLFSHYETDNMHVLEECSPEHI